MATSEKCTPIVQPKISHSVLSSHWLPFGLFSELHQREETPSLFKLHYLVDKVWIELHFRNDARVTLAAQPLCVQEEIQVQGQGWA